MKTRQLLATLILLTPATLIAQTIIDSDSFFDPDFKIRRNGETSGLLSITVTNAPVSAPGTSGNMSWNHSAGGHAQVRTSILGVANLDAQLAAYTSTAGNSLVFGREITTQADFLFGAVDVSSNLAGLTNQVAGASVLYDWNSTATVSGLAIVPDQLYRVDFTVTSGAGLPVNLLDSATFGITTAGITGASNESATLLNLLGVLSIGSNSSTGDYSFIFKSDQNRSALSFNFAADTGVGVSLLGGTANNQNVLTFSGFSVTPIPEPGSVALCGVFLGMFTFRRRR
ncbi:MAG: hypothetical protein V4584_04370 [Verrucomicrobiota bacterium]